MKSIAVPKVSNEEVGSLRRQDSETNLGQPLLQVLLFLLQGCPKFPVLQMQAQSSKQEAGPFIGLTVLAGMLQRHLILHSGRIPSSYTKRHILSRGSSVYVLLGSIQRLFALLQAPGKTSFVVQAMRDSLLKGAIQAERQKLMRLADCIY